MVSNIVQICNYASKYKEILPHNPDFSYEYVDSFTHVEDLEALVNHIHKSIPDWTDAPTILDIKNRLDNQSSVLLQYYKGSVIGWWWISPFYTNNFVDKIKSVPEGGIYCGNNYVMKDVAPPRAAAHLYSQCIKYVLQDHDCMYCWMDDWNIAPIKLCIKCGGEVKNWMELEV